MSLIQSKKINEIREESCSTIVDLTTSLKNLETSNPLLPPEVWEHIFRQLSVKHLLSVRGTCAQFKLIIDQSSALMKRFLVRVPKGSTMDSEIFRAKLGLKNLTRLDVRNISISDADLQKIGDDLPKLKNLSLTVGKLRVPYIPNFLDTFPKLEDVLIWGTDHSIQSVQKQQVNFSSIKNKNLTKLQLAEIYVTHDDLQKFFAQSSQIRNVHFYKCQFDSWADIFELTQSLKSLEKLSFSVCRAANRELTLTKKFSNLIELRIIGGIISKPSFVALLSACPDLEHVSLMFPGEYLDDAMMQVLCQKLLKMKKLSISECQISDVSLNFIREYCKVLKVLRINACPNVTMEAKNMLKRSGIKVGTCITLCEIRLNWL